MNIISFTVIFLSFESIYIYVKIWIHYKDNLQSYIQVENIINIMNIYYDAYIRTVRFNVFICTIYHKFMYLFTAMKF